MSGSEYKHVSVANQDVHVQARNLGRVIGLINSVRRVIEMTLQPQSGALGGHRHLGFSRAIGIRLVIPLGIFCIAPFTIGVVGGYYAGVEFKQWLGAKIRQNEPPRTSPIIVDPRDDSDINREKIAPSRSKKSNQ